MTNCRGLSTVSLQTKGSRALLLLLLAIMFGSWAVTEFDSAGPKPVVTEFVDCVEAVCKNLPGAGLACAIQKPLITKIVVTNNDGVKTYQFTPTNDRCKYGDD